MNSSLNSVLLCRQTKGIKPHGMKDIEPSHPSLPCDDIAADITNRVAHMEPSPRGVWEHVEDVVFRPIGIKVIVPRIGCTESSSFVPPGLPFPLDVARFIYLTQRDLLMAPGSQAEPKDSANSAEISRQVLTS